MEHHTAVEVAASPEQVWSVFVDVERWPRWTASMTRVERLDAGDLAVGSRARITQPRLGTMVWEVTELRPGSDFTWETARPGVTVAGVHRVVPGVTGCRIELAARSRGWAVPLTAPLVGRTVRRYLALEADGLKRAAEAG